MFSAHSSGDVERSVKYMAKSPPKNMSSLASHTMVPTWTMFGRLGSPVVGVWRVEVAVVTHPLWPQTRAIG
ncbi:hypothetical protein GCM10007073_02080 [Micrococcus flavus]|nr:hypothetical protein GCM10007073_02080 [Micrococcus flavus]